MRIGCLITRGSYSVEVVVVNKIADKDDFFGVSRESGQQSRPSMGGVVENIRRRKELIILSLVML